MAVALIADAHLGGPGGSAEPLVRQLRALPEQGCNHLVLLGDLFHVWVGDRRYETPEIRAVVAVLRELRAAGLPVDYIEGNRDFFVDRGPYADAFRQVVRELAFEAGGRRYLAVHGDGLDRRDWQYHGWRRISKSAVSRFLLTHLPRRLAQKVADSAEERLARTNQRHKRVIPEAAIRRYARERLAGEGPGQDHGDAQGYDCLLLGHFHEERRWCIGGDPDGREPQREGSDGSGKGEPVGEVWLLDAWFRSRRVEWVGR